MDYVYRTHIPHSSIQIVCTKVYIIMRTHGDRRRLSEYTCGWSADTIWGLGWGNRCKRAAPGHLLPNVSPAAASPGQVELVLRHPQCIDTVVELLRSMSENSKSYAPCPGHPGQLQRTAGHLQRAGALCLHRDHGVEGQGWKGKSVQGEGGAGGELPGTLVAVWSMFRTLRTFGLLRTFGRIRGTLSQHD